MIVQSMFGHMPDGKVVTQYCLSNEQGVEVEILDLGGIIRRWLVPNKNNSLTDIVLGYDTVADYLADDSYLGALVGRYANRICQGKFSLRNVEYQATVNQGGHCLHGGANGFNAQIWQSSILHNGKKPSLQLELFSPDGDQGFPADVSVKVVYTLTEENCLKIEYFASSSDTTVFNPTNHSYFNLSGHDSGSTEEHLIQIDASHYTPTDDSAIPTGAIETVKNTPFDLKSLTPIKSCLASGHQQIKYGNGLDHNLCLDNYESTSTSVAYAGQACLEGSDISLQINTSMPGLQIFTANHFANKKGKGDTLYQAHQGVCFETQFYPDSPNHAHFPSANLEKDQAFYSITEYAITF